jgi:replicative DNA helicase
LWWNVRVQKLQESEAQFLNDPSLGKAEAFYQVYVETQELGLEQQGCKIDLLFEFKESFYSELEHAEIQPAPD